MVVAILEIMEIESLVVAILEIMETESLMVVVAMLLVQVVAVDGVQVADGGGSGSCDLGDPDTFTIEEEWKYATRFEEGYDLIDPRYEAWLKKHCPTI